MQKGKGPESWKYVRKAFAGVLMRNENVFQDKGSSSNKEGKDLKEPSVMESRVQDYCLNAQCEAVRVDV